MMTEISDDNGSLMVRNEEWQTVAESCESCIKVLWMF